MTEPIAAPEVELLVFELDGQRCAADATQVLRIVRPQSPSSPGARRAVVFRDAHGGGEGQLEVDLVLGVRQVSSSDLRRLPPAARASGFALGFWLDGASPVLLLDLPRTLGPPGPETSSRKAAT